MRIDPPAAILPRPPATACNCCATAWPLLCLPACLLYICLPSWLTTLSLLRLTACLLADNYCFYVDNYDSLDAAYDWAKETLQAHSKDKREFVYTRCGSGGAVSGE
jgi:hypothetical protein